MFIFLRTKLVYILHHAAFSNISSLAFQNHIVFFMFCKISRIKKYRKNQQRIKGPLPYATHTKYNAEV